MKTISLLFLMSISSAFAQNIYVGDLVNQDNQIVSDCKVVTNTTIFNDDELILTSFEFLNVKFEDMNFRFYMKNGVNGNLYLFNRGTYKAGFLLNTDRMFNILQVSFFGRSENYTCIINRVQKIQTYGHASSSF